MSSAFTTCLESAAADARRRVYEKLWLELTIAGRMVWDGKFDALEKVEGLKWLNEIQHRVWGAHADPVRISPTHLYSTIQHHAAQASALKGVIDVACLRSLRAIADVDQESE